MLIRFVYHYRLPCVRSVLDKSTHWKDSVPHFGENISEYIVNISENITGGLAQPVGQPTLDFSSGRDLNGSWVRALQSALC